MSATPAEDETAAILAAILRITAPAPQTIAIGESRWHVAARHESVRSNLPATWRD